MMVVLVLSVLNYQFELSAYLLVLKLSTTLDAG
jgi:hypothetical protein